MNKITWARIVTLILALIGIASFGNWAMNSKATETAEQARSCAEQVKTDLKLIDQREDLHYERLGEKLDTLAATQKEILKEIRKGRV